MRKFLAFLLFSATAIADQTVLVDPYFSPFTGANALLFSEWGGTMLEDTLRSSSTKDTTLSIVGRALEQSVWLSFNQVSCVIQHEVFGHGYRLRELGFTPSGYTISWGSGATYFSVNDSFLVGNMLAVDVAGLEAEGVMARIAKMDWIAKGSLDGRLAMTYFQAEQSPFFYTLITHLGRLSGQGISKGNDIDSYLTYLNATYPQDNLSLGQLTLWSAFNWLDPMTFYSLYSWFYYIAAGESWAIPMIRLSDSIHYLPNVKIGYAPYGPEAYLENYFRVDTRPLYAYLKGGKGSFGMGGIYEYLLDKKNLSFGLHLDGWIQRQYLSNATLGDFDEGRSVAAPNTKIWGGALSITARATLFSIVQLFGEIGGKSGGYLPGYQLSGGLVARLGFTLKDY